MKLSKQLVFSFVGLGVISTVLGVLIALTGSVIVAVIGIVTEIGLIRWSTIYFKQSFVSQLKEAMSVLGNIGLGDTSGSIAMGNTVNCSKLSNCGETSCPSYGKEDHCWVTSGSFAIVKSCPRALKGEDCRTCEMYVVKNEIEELGSIIGGLSNYFNAREKLALEIATGDLTKEVNLASEKDTLGKALKVMTNNLNKIVKDVQDTAKSVVIGSKQLAQASQSLSDGSSEQASSLEEIFSSMNDIGNRAKINNENATKAQAISEQALSGLKNGNQQMESMLQSMTKINDTSSSVTKVIKVIDEIAFQTNLLSLNAAVEAARAGKYGKGFGVVAEEVRNLAGRSAKAAKESNLLIDQSVKEVENGVKKADQTADILNEINLIVENVYDLVAEITTASQDQNFAIGEINKALETMNSVVQQNSSIAEETAGSSEELSNQAGQLQKNLNVFKLENASINQFESVRSPRLINQNSVKPNLLLEN